MTEEQFELLKKIYQNQTGDVSSAKSIVLIGMSETYGSVAKTFTIGQDFDFVFGVAIAQNPHDSYNGSSASASYVSKGQLVCQTANPMSNAGKHGTNCVVIMLKNVKAGDKITLNGSIDGAVAAFGLK